MNQKNSESLEELKEIIARFRQGSGSIDRFMKDHQLNPPFPGAVFDEQKHRWVVSNKMSGYYAKAPSEQTKIQPLSEQEKNAVSQEIESLRDKIQYDEGRRVYILSSAEVGFNNKEKKLVFGIQKTAEQLKAYKHIEKIKVSELIPSQTEIPVEGIIAYAEDMPHVLPEVARMPDGKLRIFSGHTRIAAQYFAGRREVTAEVFQVDENFRPIKSIGMSQTQKDLVSNLFAEWKKDFDAKKYPFARSDVAITAYRVGNLNDPNKRGIFFSADKAGAEAYASLHEGEEVRAFNLNLDSVLIAGHQNSVTSLFFGKTYGNLIDGFGGGPEAARKLDRKIKAEAMKRGYNGIVYLTPAPPADSEIVVFSTQHLHSADDMQKAEIQEMPDPYSSEIFDWADDMVEKSGLPIPGNHPRGAKEVGKQLEADLYASLSKKISEYLSHLDPATPMPQIYHDIEQIIAGWQKGMQGQIDEAFQLLYTKGVMAGVLASGVAPAMGYADQMALEFIKQDPNRIGHRIVLFTQDLVKKFQTVIATSYEPSGIFNVKTMTEQMQEIVPAERWKLERVVRTETASISNCGRLLAWSKDPDKYLWDYNWQNTIDHRSKPISLRRGEGNPYSFSEIAFLWERQSEIINGKEQVDWPNQRCSISRTPRDDENRAFRFAGLEAFYPITTTLGFEYDK